MIKLSYEVKTGDHLDHNLVVTQYKGRDGATENVVVECEDCYEVVENLYDVNEEDLGG